MRARHAHPDALSMQAKLTALNLPFMRENYQPLAHTAADKHWSHLDYFTELLNGEAAAREDRRVQRCIRQARFPVLKTIDQFDWNWPTKINRPQIQNLFHLDFVAKHANVVFISGVGLGKSHLMTALGYAACQRGHSVLFTGAIDIINTLTPRTPPVTSRRRWRSTQGRKSCSSMNWATCPSTSSAPTACSRSSVTDTSAVRRC